MKMTPSLKKQIEKTSRILEASIGGPQPRYYWKAAFNPELTALELESINYHQEIQELNEPNRDPRLIAEEIRSSLVDIKAIAEKVINDWPSVYNVTLAEDKAEAILGENHPQTYPLKKALLDSAKKKNFRFF